MDSGHTAVKSRGSRRPKGGKGGKGEGILGPLIEVKTGMKM